MTGSVRTTLLCCKFGFLLVLLAACSSLPVGPPARTLPVAEDGWLDQYVAQLALAPGESAYQLEDRNHESFALRMHSARAAVRSIDAQYYLWHDDLTGRLLASELLAAAERGVRVRILIDDTASRAGKRLLAALDTHPLIEIRLFNPWRTRDSAPGRVLEFFVRLGRPNYRMHNKLWLVDGRLMLTGGRNIGDEYFGADDRLNFTDLGVLLYGVVVAEAQTSFDVYWNAPHQVVPIRALRKRDPALDQVREQLDGFRSQTLTQPFAQQVLGAQGPRAEALAALTGRLLRGSSVRFVADAPDKRDGAVAGMRLLAALGELLGQAQRELVLVSPYFVPRRAGVQALAGLRNRGAAVHVLTNSLAATDVAAAHGGYSKRRRALLAAGILLYELKQEGGGPRPGRRLRGGSSGASLHSKGVVVDAQTAFVGSFNLDPRSARINTENGVFITDARFAGHVRAHWVHASDPEHSWSVRLGRGGLSWTSKVDGQVRVLQREPPSSPGARLVAWLFRWLPLESQL